MFQSSVYIKKRHLCYVFFSQNGKPMSTPNAKSVASGLAPPFAGALTHAHVSAHCAGVLLVSEDQLCEATRKCYDRGVKVEPAGAAAVAAVLASQ